MDYVCDVLFCGIIDLFSNSEPGGKPKPLCFTAMYFNSTNLVPNTVIPWRTLILLILYILWLMHVFQAMNGIERRQFSSCSAVGCKKKLLGFLGCHA